MDKQDEKPTFTYTPICMLFGELLHTCKLSTCTPWSSTEEETT